MTKSIDEQILERLDQILRAISLQVGSDKSVTERVRLLKLAGLDNRTIAQVLGTTDATVRALSAIQRQHRPSGRGRSVKKKKRGRS